jgi:hypothetical protein
VKKAAIVVAFAGLVYASGCGGNAYQDRASESAYPCNPNVDVQQCCDPGTGLRSSPVCDESGRYARCAANLDLLGPGEECVVKPPACRVRDASDLEGQACSTGDPECDFGSGYVLCGCTCAASERGRAWGCACALH